MKVLHINCNYIGTTLHQLMVEELGHNGYDNQVYVPTYNRKISVIETNDNVIVSECFKKWDRLIFDYKQMKIMRDLQKKVEDFSKFNFIHAYTLFTDGNCARKMSKKYNIPYVVAVRNTDINAFFAKMIHLRSRGIKIMRDAKAIFFLSESYRKQVFQKFVPKKFYEELWGKSFIVPNGIDDFWFNNEPCLSEKKILKDSIKLIYAGRIDKNKNIPTIQRAMDILLKRGYQVDLTVVGRVEDEAEFQIISKNPNTTCLPPMNKEELITAYRSADIFVMPSFTESFGLVYVEAMSQGLPVVYSKGQGFDGQFDEGIVGYHVDSHSAESVAEAIIRIIDNYSSFTSTVVEKSKKFNWSEIVKSYCKIYDEIIQQEKGC